MESARFDRFARMLGVATSRRASIGVAVAAITGAALAAPAEAATVCRRGRQTCQRNSQCCSGTCQTGRGFSTRDRNRCACEDGLELCNNACVDTNTDVRHCGTCGNRCGAGDHCVEGTCRIDQQCFTNDGRGLCYMTPAGFEHRVDGIYFNHGLDMTGVPAIDCRRDSDCHDDIVHCSQPGVRCTCIRALDAGPGYSEEIPAGRGVCVPLLDDGEGGSSCVEEEGVTLCGFTATGHELSVCIDSITVYDTGCNGTGCDGVGPCDDEGVTCACIIASMRYGLYVDVNPYDDPQPPTCVVYRSPDDGSCELPN